MGSGDLSVMGWAGATHITHSRWASMHILQHYRTHIAPQIRLELLKMVAMLSVAVF